MNGRPCWPFGTLYKLSKHFPNNSLEYHLLHTTMIPILWLCVYFGRSLCPKFIGHKDPVEVKGVGKHQQRQSLFLGNVYLMPDVSDYRQQIHVSWNDLSVRWFLCNSPAHSNVSRTKRPQSLNRRRKKTTR